VPFDDSAALSDSVNELLDDEVYRKAMRRKAYTYSCSMVWNEVGKAYIKLAKEIMEERRRQPRPVFYFRSRKLETDSLPEINLSHVRRLTDPTGILQHATYGVPDRHHGYCTDDNSRALVAALLYYHLRQDESVLALADTYLSFLSYAFVREGGQFHNQVGYDRRWMDEGGGEDVHGRALWSLGLATALAPNDALVSFAARLFQAALETGESLTAPRAWAFGLVGIHAYLQRFQGDAFARRVLSMLAKRLHKRFGENASPDWPWCEDVVTYANAKLPHALILGGAMLSEQSMLQLGLQSLDWLVRMQLNQDGTVSIIGNKGWMCRSGERARFDQQPIEVMSLVEACAAAYRCTQDESWINRARQCFGWFLGANDTRSVLYDYQTGGCRDGPGADGPNLNESAESTLAWLISLIALCHMEEGRDLAQGGQNLRLPAEQKETVPASEPAAWGGVQERSHNMCEEKYARPAR